MNIKTASEYNRERGATVDDYVFNDGGDRDAIEHRADGAKIERITAAEAEAGRRLREQWRSRALATGSADRDAFCRGVALAYGSVGLAPPKVNWQPSPMAGLCATAVAIFNGRPTITGVLVDKPLAAADRQLAAEISREVLDVLNREFVERLVCVRSALDVVVDELDIRAEVIGDARPRVGTVLRKLLQRVVFGALDFRLVVHDFAARVLGCGDRSLDGLVLAGSAAGWWWPFENVVVATDRPSRIELDDEGRAHSAAGRAIEYSDAFGVCARHGVRIPPEAMTNAVDWEAVKSTADGGVRDAIADMKVEKWSVEKKPADETVEERQDAAAALKRLGGFDALKDLTEK